MSSPKYLESYEAVPVQIPDDFSQKDKTDAVELAEGLIEVRLNQGRTLDKVTPIHIAAIKQRATCELVKGASDPDNVSIGDIQDDGTSKSDYAHQSFCDHFNELISDIKSFKDASSAGPMVYNTGKSQSRQNWERFTQDIDVKYPFDIGN